jgi:hypothetical protein
MDERFEQIQKLCNELEALEKRAHSKDIQLPKDWFWHRDCIQAVRNLQKSVQAEIDKVGDEFTENYTYDSNIGYLLRNLKDLVMHLDEELKRAEGQDVKYEPDRQKNINALLSGLDGCLTSLVQQFPIIEEHNSEDTMMKRKKQLLALGFNIYRYPELTELLVSDWSIIEDLLDIIGSHETKTYTYYVWRVLPSFLDLIFREMSLGEVGALLRNPNIKPYLHRGSSFFEQHGAKKEIVKKIEAFEKTAVSLKKIILLITMIISGGTIGEDLGRRVVEELLPNFKKLINIPEDLEIIYLYISKRYEKHKRTSARNLAEQLINFAKLYEKEKEALFDVLDDVRKKQNFDEYRANAILRCCLYLSRFINTTAELKEMAEQIGNISAKWVEKDHWQRDRDRTEEISAVLANLNEIILTREDLDILFQLMRATDSHSVELILYLVKTAGFREIEKDPSFVIRLINQTKPPLLFIKLLESLTDTKSRIQELKLYPATIEFVAYNFNQHPNAISLLKREWNLNLSIFRNPQEFEQLLGYLDSKDANIIGNIFSVLVFLKPYQITSFKLFIENGGKEVLESIEKYKDIDPERHVLRFCSIILAKADPKNYREVISIFNKIFVFINKEVEDNKVKLGNLSNINQISQTVFRQYGDYLFYVMETAPKHFMNILFAISHIHLMDETISKELVQLTRICRSFRLYIDENKVEDIKPQDIENTYLFLVEQLGKKPKIDKLRKNIEKFGTQHSRSAFEFINTSIMNLSVEYFLHLTRVKVRDAFEKFCGVPLPPELDGNHDAVNALLIAKECNWGQNKELAKIFIRELCLKNTVPFKKYPDAYPYNQEANKEWVRRMEVKGINLKLWIEGYKNSYDTIFTDALENREIIINSHIEEVIEHYKELGYEVKEDAVFEKFEEIKEKAENKALVADIKQHLSTITSLKQQRLHISNTKRIIIYVETEPLKVLQMGNVVSGSCLMLGGCNSWAAIVNALDINKKVLYAVDEKDNLVGRRLITMTDQGRIIQYGVYNNVLDIDLDIMFQRFTIELAQKCNTEVANGGTTSTLVAENWYAGTAIAPFKLSEKTSKLPPSKKWPEQPSASYQAT